MGHAVLKRLTLLTILVLVGTRAAGAGRNRSPKHLRVTGGAVAFGQLLAHHRDVVDQGARAKLARRRTEVLIRLHEMNCAITLAEPAARQADLFGSPPATDPDAWRAGLRHEDSREATFINDLLAFDLSSRKRAYDILVNRPEFITPIKEPVFLAVAALIEANVRSPFVEMFLTLRTRWPSEFADRLRDLAAHGTAVDRRYVVNLIRAAGQLGDPQVRRAFYLRPGREDADLDLVVISHGRVLFGEDFG